MAPRQRPPSCHGCPAHTSGAVGFVPGVGPQEAVVALVGQGPGEAEAEFSTPFYPEAPSGARLTKWLHRSGFQRTEVAIGNVVQCQLPGNREPTRAEAAYCWQRHVGPWLASFPNLTHVVPVGVPATKWLLGLDWDRAAERFAGTTQLVELPPVLETPQ